MWQSNMIDMMDLLLFKLPTQMYPPILRVLEVANEIFSIFNIFFSLDYWLFNVIKTWITASQLHYRVQWQFKYLGNDTSL